MDFMVLGWAPAAGAWQPAEPGRRSIVVVTPFEPKARKTGCMTNVYLCTVTAALHAVIACLLTVVARLHVVTAGLYAVIACLRTVTACKALLGRELTARLR